MCPLPRRLYKVIHLKFGCETERVHYSKWCNVLTLYSFYRWTLSAFSNSPNGLTFCHELSLQYLWVYTNCIGKWWQCPLLAPLVYSPQMVWKCVCVDGMNLKYAPLWHISTYQFIPCYASVYTPAHVCVCGWNELEVCTTLTYINISVHFMLCQCIHTNTRILKPFEDSKPTGLKVDIAKRYEH